MAEDQTGCIDWFQLLSDKCDNARMCFWHACLMRKILAWLSKKCFFYCVTSIEEEVNENKLIDLLKY